MKTWRVVLSWISIIALIFIAQYIFFQWTGVISDRLIERLREDGMDFSQTIAISSAISSLSLATFSLIYMVFFPIVISLMGSIFSLWKKIEKLEAVIAEIKETK